MRVKDKIRIFFGIYFCALFCFIMLPWTFVNFVNKMEPFVGPLPWSVFCVLADLSLVTIGMAVFQYLEEKYEGHED